jgi:hypothetical protein
MSSSGLAPWGEFSQDPRRPESTRLRASDRDRDVVLRVLADGYADGRLTREEYDERSATTATARTLGELPALVEDLVPSTTVARDELALASPTELQQMAVEAYKVSRRRAVSGTLSASTLTTGIWFATSFGNGFHPGFFWPMFVILFVALNLVRVLVNKQEIVESERRSLEKKQRKALEPPPP